MMKPISTFIFSLYFLLSLSNSISLSLSFTYHTPHSFHSMLSFQNIRSLVWFYFWFSWLSTHIQQQEEREHSNKVHLELFLFPFRSILSLLRSHFLFQWWTSSFLLLFTLIFYLSLYKLHRSSIFSFVSFSLTSSTYSPTISVWDWNIRRAKISI